MRLPDEKIEEVRAATDIVELIGGFVSLKKAGKNWKGLCPFHTERTPSFHVMQDRGIFHCFGCGSGGNAYSFMMEHEGMGFLDAVRFLAERAGIALPKPGRGGDAESDAQETTVRANRAALDWFRATLADESRGRVAREYLANRGIARDAIETFAIGCAPTGWDGLLSHLVRLGFEPDALERAGLVIRSERSGSYYDRFRERVIFPILGPTGQAIAFGGRILADGEPKYLNSPETPVFRKGRGLFGLYVNRGGIREAGDAILVEGYTDLIALHMAGIRNVVAPLGTAFTPEQGKLLSNHARRVTLFYDGDSAGRAAAQRALPSLLSAGISVRIAPLPTGADPDEFARAHGADAVRDLLARAAGWVQHVASETAPLGREEQARRVVELLSFVSDPLTLGVQLSDAAGALTLPEETLRQALASRRGRTESDALAAPKRAAMPDVAPASALHKIERELVALLLREPHLAPDVARYIAADDYEDAGSQKLAEALYAPSDSGAIADSHSILYRFANDPRLTRIITEAFAAPEEGAPPEVLAKDRVVKILRCRLEKIRHELREDLRRAQGCQDAQAQDRLLSEIGDNKRACQELQSVVQISIEARPSLYERSHPE